MEVLVIKDGTDIDIVLENGGYSFSWKINGLRKIECYQERINKILDLDFLAESKSYYAEFPDDTVIDFIVKYAIDWHTSNEVKDAKITIMEKGLKETEDLINEFLNFK